MSAGIMFGGAIRDAFSLGLGNAALLALPAALPVLLVGYAYYGLSARRIRADFALSKLESIEFDRAVLLYEKARNRLKEIYHDGELAGKSWRARRRRRDQLRGQYREELDDLESYARDLRSTIARLRRRPIRRYRRWVHVLSSRFAFSRALAAYLLLLALLTVAFLFSEQPVWAQGLSSFETFVRWNLHSSLNRASWLAAGLVALAIPLFYFARRARLHREHAPQLRALKELAATDPDRLIHQPLDDREALVKSPEISGTMLDEKSWFAVLGVPPSATIEQVKRAYKAKIKQNHPDRIHGMSPALKKLAETETGKLNAAYEEALAVLQDDTRVN